MRRAALPPGGIAALTLISLASCNPSASEKAAPPGQRQPGVAPQFFTEVRSGIFFPNKDVVERVLSVKPLRERLIPLCNGAPPTASRVVKLRVGHNGLRIKALNRNIVGKKYSGGDAKSVPEPPLNADSTAFDMIMNSDAYGTDNYVALKIILKDDDIYFPGDEYSITTVYENDINESSIFKCLDKVVDGEDVSNNKPENSNSGGTKYDYATVYIDRAVKLTQKFNIRLVVKQDNSDYIMPVILDPNIKNDG